MLMTSVCGCRSQFGLVYVHLGVDSQSPEIRRSVNASLVNSAVVAPQLTKKIIREALTTFLARGPPSPSKPSTSNTSEEATIAQPWNKHSRLSSLLLSTVSFSDDIDTVLREDAVIELIILAHHPLICPYVSLFLSVHAFTYRFVLQLRWT